MALLDPPDFTDKGVMRYAGFKVVWRQNLLEQEAKKCHGGWC